MIVHGDGRILLLPWLVAVILSVCVSLATAQTSSNNTRIPCLLTGIDQLQLMQTLVDYYVQNPSEAAVASVMSDQLTTNATAQGQAGTMIYYIGNPNAQSDINTNTLEPCVYLDQSDFALYEPILQVNDVGAIVMLADVLPNASYLRSAAAFYRYFQLLQSLQNYCNETRSQMFQQLLYPSQNSSSSSTNGTAPYGPDSVCPGCAIDSATRSVLYIVENVLDIVCYLYGSYVNQTVVTNDTLANVGTTNTTSGTNTTVVVVVMVDGSSTNTTATNTTLVTNTTTSTNSTNSTTSSSSTTTTTSSTSSTTVMLWDMFSRKLESWGIWHGMAYRSEYTRTVFERMQQQIDGIVNNEQRQSEHDGYDDDDDDDEVKEQRRQHAHSFVNKFDRVVRLHVDQQQQALVQQLRDTNFYRRLVTGVIAAAQDPGFSDRFRGVLSRFYDTTHDTLERLRQVPNRIAQRLEKIRSNVRDMNSYHELVRRHVPRGWTQWESSQQQPAHDVDPVADTASKLYDAVLGNRSDSLWRGAVERSVLRGAIRATEFMRWDFLRSVRLRGDASDLQRPQHVPLEEIRLPYTYYDDYRSHYDDWRLRHAMNTSATSAQLQSFVTIGYDTIAMLSDATTTSKLAELATTPARGRMKRMLRHRYRHYEHMLTGGWRTSQEEYGDWIQEQPFERMSRSFVTTLTAPSSNSTSKEPFTGYGSSQNNVLQLFSWQDDITWLGLQVNWFFFNNRSNANRQQGIYAFPEIVSFEYGSRAVIIDVIPNITFPNGFDPNNPHCDQYNTTVWDRARFAWYLTTNWFVYPMYNGTQKSFQPLISWLVYDPNTGQLPPNLLPCCFVLADAFILLFALLATFFWLIALLLELSVAVGIADRFQAHDEALGDITMAILKLKHRTDRHNRVIKERLLNLMEMG